MFIDSRIPVPASLKSQPTKCSFWEFLAGQIFLEFADDLPQEALDLRIHRELETVLDLPPELEAEVIIQGVGPVRFNTTDTAQIYSLHIAARAAADPNEQDYLEFLRGALDESLDDEEAAAGVTLSPWRYAGPGKSAANVIPLRDKDPMRAMVQTWGEDHA